ncbi:J domain-containing protein 1 [Ophidiomyces ophidiicola]|nr:J domain-containing protein 1 [Ophidiomyces ophidiicola]KAI1935019.1 J domain-containing protein 1 [Ophidiomyces ophidiicola]KAI1966886.1 J domain-containing protein 1 [Ophidiomyces ophidiicola]
MSSAILHRDGDHAGHLLWFEHFTQVGAAEPLAIIQSIPSDDSIPVSLEHIVMFKKSSLLCSRGGVPLLNSPSSISPHPRRRSLTFQNPQRFAHVNSGDPIQGDGDFSWPTSSTFSPYELLKLDRNSPYSKRRFYELVKIYHPDRSCDGHPLCKDIPDSVRMNRYRILVAAHELLSDPRKREAYDKYGDGWHHRHELFGVNAKKDSSQSTVRYRYKPKKRGDDIFKNATWEDWEEFYERRDGQSKQAQTVSHSTFASFLLLLALFGGVGQAITVGKYSTYVQERVRDVNDRCGKFLEGRKHHTINKMNSQDARVQSFLMKRDPSGYGLKEEEEETYRRLLGVRRTSDIMTNIDSMRNTAE